MELVLHIHRIVLSKADTRVFCISRAAEIDPGSRKSSHGVLGGGRHQYSRIGMLSVQSHYAPLMVHAGPERRQ